MFKNHSAAGDAGCAGWQPAGVHPFGDFINADYLGSTETTMIGNVIQKRFLVIKDYPVAAAMSFVLMALILAGVLLLHESPGHRGSGVMTSIARLRGVTVQGGHHSDRAGPQLPRLVQTRDVTRGWRPDSPCCSCPADPGDHRLLRSTSRRASSTTPGRASRWRTGCTRSNTGAGQSPAAQPRSGGLSTAIALVLGTFGRDRPCPPTVPGQQSGRHLHDPAADLTRGRHGCIAAFLTLFLSMGWATGFS